MEFPVEKVTVVDCHDLDKYILDEYHMKVDTLNHCLEMWSKRGQNSFIELNINHYGPESCWEIEEWTADAGIQLIEEWLNGPRDYDVELVLWHLMHQGKIPEGDYLIKLRW